MRYRVQLIVATKGKRELLLRLLLLHQFHYLAFVGIVSTDPNLVQAIAPTADANLTDYLLLKKVLKSKIMKKSAAFLG